MIRVITRLLDRIRSARFAGPTGCQADETGPAGDGDGFGVPLDTALSGWFNPDSGELFSGFVIRKHDVVLDVGCGDSPFARFCAGQGASVMFTDIDAAKVRATRQAVAEIHGNRSSPFVSDCTRLPLKKESVDKIISLEVLEHVDDPAAFMHELVRAGKPGARFLITVPDPVIENLQKNGLAPDVYFSKPNHIHIWERAAFAELVVDAGLDIERTARFGFYWSMWWVFFWACRQDLAPPWHPLLKSWTATWSTLLETEDGARIKRALDDFMPKTQMIIARKP
jgi:SAM-dependent methyltransferase